MAHKDSLKIKHETNEKTGLTLVETVASVLIIALAVIIVQASLMSKLTKNAFENEAHSLVSALQLATTSAARSDKRYEIIIDITEQTFTLREITTLDLDDVLDEEIVDQQSFTDNCLIDYIVFDDLISTDEQHQIAKFRVGHSGFQYGGKIVLLDRNLQPYSIVVSRLSKIIKLQKGDVPMLLPKRDDEIFF